MVSHFRNISYPVQMETADYYESIWYSSQVVPIVFISRTLLLILFSGLYNLFLSFSTAYFMEKKTCVEVAFSIYMYID